MGLPADLLSERPDVRSAERRLQAATARVGVAIANRFPFPTIGLSAFAGRFTTSVGDLVDDGSDIFSWGPVASVPILDFGRTRAAVGIADAQLLQATEGYKSAVLGALRELADAAAGFKAAGTIIDFTEQRAEAAAEVLRLQRQRFRQGVVAYLEVLDGERQLLSAELELAQAEFSRVQRFIDLYRAFGGGADEQRLTETLGRLGQQAGAHGRQAAARPSPE
jgi:multidrug efflux system outer membrane protein